MANDNSVKPVLIVQEVERDGEMFLRVCGEASEVHEAKRDLRDFPPGTYSIARYHVHRLQVEPPPQTTRNRVVGGQTFIERKRRSTTNQQETAG